MGCGHSLYGWTGLYWIRKFFHKCHTEALVWAAARAEMRFVKADMVDCIEVEVPDENL